MILLAIVASCRDAAPAADQGADAPLADAGAGEGSDGAPAAAAPVTEADRAGDAPDSAPPSRRLLAPPDDPREARFLGLAAPKPARWVWHPPEAEMRIANWVVPGASGGNQAHLVVFEMSAGPEAIITRWAERFRPPAAASPTLDVRREHFEADGLDVMLVEIAGDHMRMGAEWYTEDQLMLAALLTGPLGDVQIRLLGDRETVEANRADFIAMIRGLRRSAE